MDTLIKCPDCGQLVLPGSATCPSCGYPFPEETAQAAVSPGTVLNADANAGADANQHVPRPAAGNQVSRGTKRVWYYEVHGFVYGPKSADSIYGSILNGQLLSNVNVWRPGSANWAPAADYILFSKEGPTAEDVAEQDSPAESNALPPMISMDGKTTYKYYPESPTQNPQKKEMPPYRVPQGLTPSSETPVEKTNGVNGEKSTGGCLKGCLIVAVVFLLLVFWALRGCSTTNTPSNTPTTTTIDLQASVNFTGTQFVITNNDSFAWTNVEIQINYGVIADGFILTTARVEAGTTYTVGAMQFAKADGTRFDPFTMKPQKFEIQADTPKGTGWYFGGWD